MTAALGVSNEVNKTLGIILVESDMITVPVSWFL
jgi:hypothetical protein